MAFHQLVPRKIMLGPRLIDDLHTQEFPGHYALIIAAEDNEPDNILLRRLIPELNAAHVRHTVFDLASSDITFEMVIQGAYWARIYRCDFIIGLGSIHILQTAGSIAAIAFNSIANWSAILTGATRPAGRHTPPLPLVTVSALDNGDHCVAFFTGQYR